MMKKNTSKKSAAAKKQISQKNNVGAVAHSDDKKRCPNAWSLSVYIYWFIILFFIAATFYILGLSHSVRKAPAPANNVEINEEELLSPSDYYETGKTKLLSGNIDEAITDLTAAIESNPEDVDSYVLRGEANMQSAKYREAMADFDEAIKLDPVNAVAYYDRSLLNTRLEDYSAALNDINNALASQAAKPSLILRLRDLYAKRGQLNLWTKNWEGAIADYTNSLARPEGIVNPAVYAERAEAYTALGNYQDAINDYDSAIRIISEQILGAVSTEEREALSSQAMSYFEKSAALNLNLGNIDFAHNDLESAYRIALSLGDSDNADRLQGLILALPQQ